MCLMGRRVTGRGSRDTGPERKHWDHLGDSDASLAGLGLSRGTVELLLASILRYTLSRTSDRKLQSKFRKRDSGILSALKA